MPVAKKIVNYQLRTLLSISAIWILFAFMVLYNITDLKTKVIGRLTPLKISAAFGVIGFIISAALVFYLRDAFKRYPLWLALILKLLFTFSLFLILGFILVAFYSATIHGGDFPAYFKHFFEHVIASRSFVIFMADLTIMTFVTIILIEVTYKYGPGMFWSMLRGEYHNPKIENRIFLFLDMNDSTAIAERLGSKKFFLMLKDFFADVTVPVLANEGHIYQYVGDEIVISWANTNANKLRCLKFIRNTFFFLKRAEKRYKRRYNAEPAFKVGVHSGEVTAGFIGVVKKDLIYSGDTINTTARITSMCKELDQAFILSEDFMRDFSAPPSYHIKTIGEIEMKGRSEPVKLYTLTFE